MSNPVPLSRLYTLLLGSFLFVVPFLLFFALVQVWPKVDAAALLRQDVAAKRTSLEQARQVRAALVTIGDPASEATKNLLLKADEAIENSRKELVDTISRPQTKRSDTLLDNNPEMRLLMLVVIAGALGSSILAAKTFAYRMGSQTQQASWLWWYFLRLPTGAGIALILYFALRGGLFAGSFSDQTAALDKVNPFGFVAIGALSGMFAGQASDKLEEIFEGLFRTLPKTGWPVLATPAKVKAPVTPAEVTVRLSASGARPNSVVVVDNKVRDGLGHDDNGLSFKLTPAEVTLAPGQTKTYKIKVRNPGPPERTSDEVDLVVEG